MPILSFSAPNSNLPTMPPTMMIETAIAPTEAPSSPCAQKAGICWKNAAHMQKMPATRISVYIAGDLRASSIVAPSFSAAATAAAASSALRSSAFSSAWEAPKGRTFMTEGDLRTNAAHSTTEATVVTRESTKRAVCQPYALMRAWPTGLAMAASRESVAAEMLTAIPAPFSNQMLISTGAARYMKNAAVTPNTTPYKFSGKSGRNRSQAKNSRHGGHNPARIVLLQQLASKWCANRRNDRLNRSIHRGIGLAPTKLIHNGSNKNTRRVGDDARRNGIKTYAANKHEPCPNRPAFHL